MTTIPLDRVRCRVGPNEYQASLAGTKDDRLVFLQERVTEHGLPGESRDSVVGSGHFETILPATREEGEAPAAQQRMTDLLRGCRVYHFHDTGATAPIKQPGPTADNLALHADAGNLAAVLWVLRERAPATYRRIVGTVRLAAPFFGDFILAPETANDTIRLRWQHVDSDRVFSAHQLSDGTLRLISLATLLLDAERLPSLPVLDEPEFGLHPFAIVQLADMLRSAAVGSQVVVTTQSVTLIDQIELPDLIVVERVQGSSVSHRPGPARLREWLDEYSLGDLWQKNLIGGRPRREAA